MKELVVISGKGGTGKTSITASFAALAKNAVFADCDVDAADLHLVLKPEIQSKHVFVSGKEASIRQEDCIMCGRCQKHCRFDAIEDVIVNGAIMDFKVNPLLCEGCGVWRWKCVRLMQLILNHVNAASGISLTRALAKWFMPSYILQLRTQANL